jgi:hypothetical protein
MSDSYSTDASVVNDYNRKLSNIASARSLEAYNILNSCKNISQSAYSTYLASILYSQGVINTDELIMRGTIPPNISLNNTLGLEQNTQNISTIDASANILLEEQETNLNNTLNNTRIFLNTTKILINTLSQKLLLRTLLDTLLKKILKSFSDSFTILLNSEKTIVSKDILGSNDIPLYTLYLPTVPIKNSLTSCNDSISIIRAFLTEDINVTQLIQDTMLFSTNLDTVARENNTTAYDYAVIAKSNPINIYKNASITMTQVALASDITASNYRNILNTIVSIKTTYDNLVSIDDSVKEIFTDSINSLLHIHLLVDPIIKNSSEGDARLLNRKIFNQVQGELNRINDIETKSFTYSKDIRRIYDFIISAEEVAINTIATNPVSTEKLLRFVNSITDEAEKQYNNAKDNAIILNTTASNLVTVNSIDAQTKYSINTASSMLNAASRKLRESNSTIRPPLKNTTTYKADIRVKSPILSINRPENRPENYIYKIPEEKKENTIRTLLDSKLRITKESDKIKYYSELKK